MFKKIFLPLIAVACFAPLTYADVSGSVGVDSDYFWSLVAIHSLVHFRFLVWFTAPNSRLAQ